MYAVYSGLMARNPTSYVSSLTFDMRPMPESARVYAVYIWIQINS